MNNISPLIPTIIIFIVGVNLIESLIKNFIGRDKGKNKENKMNNREEGKKKRKKIFNTNWSLRNENNKQKDNENDKNDENDEKNSILKENNDVEEEYFRNKKGRMADYMDNKESSIYENKNKTKVKRRKKTTKDFPDEIKIGENSLFNRDNLKGDILKGIVMKEILDKPRAKRPYKSPYREN